MSHRPTIYKSSRVMFASNKWTFVGLSDGFNDTVTNTNIIYDQESGPPPLTYVLVVIFKKHVGLVVT